MNFSVKNKRHCVVIKTGVSLWTALKLLLSVNDIGPELVNFSWVNLSSAFFSSVNHILVTKYFPLVSSMKGFH